jgi:hypothetical protein
LPGTKTPAYYGNPQIKAVKSFVIPTPGAILKVNYVYLLKFSRKIFLAGNIFGGIFFWWEMIFGGKCFWQEIIFGGTYFWREIIFGGKCLLVRNIFGGKYFWWKIFLAGNDFWREILWREIFLAGTSAGEIC